MEISPEKLVSLSAIIALDLSKDKSLEEINTYKHLFSLIANNLQAICNQKLNNKPK